MSVSNESVTVRREVSVTAVVSLSNISVCFVLFLSSSALIS